MDGREFTPGIVAHVEELLEGEGWPHARLRQMMFRSNPNRRGKIIFYMFEEGRRRPTYAVKLARSEFGREMLRHECAIFARLLAQNRLLQASPRRLYCDKRDTVFVLEHFHAGGPLMQRFGSPEHENLATDWLARFQASPGDRCLGAADLLEFVDGPCATARAEGIVRLVDHLRERITGLAPFELRDVPVHGDFNHSNLLLAGDVVHATDWEFARCSGWHLEDLWRYFVAAARRVDMHKYDCWHNVPGTVQTLLGETWYSNRMREVLYAFADTAGCPRALVPIFGLAEILRGAVLHREEQVDWRDGRAGTYMEVLTALDRALPQFLEFWEAPAAERPRPAYARPAGGSAGDV
jgi:hypothetical protein